MELKSSKSYVKIIPLVIYCLGRVHTLHILMKLFQETKRMWSGMCLAEFLIRFLAWTKLAQIKQN